jgi:nitroreductase
MTNQVLSAISERRSIRDYKPEPVTDEQIEIILKAAQEAPSARNEQPWHFTVVRNREIIREVNEESNKNLGEDHGDIFHGAPAVIFISAERGWMWSKVDSGIAVMSIALAAHSIGLGSVILGLPRAAFNGARENYFNKLLKFPENYEFAVAMAIGAPNATKGAHPIKPGRIAFVN